MPENLWQSTSACFYLKLFKMSLPSGGPPWGPGWVLSSMALLFLAPLVGAKLPCKSPLRKPPLGGASWSAWVLACITGVGNPPVCQSLLGLPVPKGCGVRFGTLSQVWAFVSGFQPATGLFLTVFSSTALHLCSTQQPASLGGLGFRKRLLLPETEISKSLHL